MPNENQQKEIEKIFNDPKYQKNFRLFPEFVEIAKFLAEDYGNLVDVPKILKNTKIKVFGRSANIGALQEQNNVATTSALGLSNSVMNEKLNVAYKERTIYINQNYDDRNNFDFEDFSALYGTHKVFKRGKKDPLAFLQNEEQEAQENLESGKIVIKLDPLAGCEFDRLRREEVTSGNKILEQRLFNTVDRKELRHYKKTHKDIANMSYKQQTKLFYKPQIRVKEELLREELKNFFEGNFESENKKVEKQDLFEEKATLCHEFLHSLTKRRGTYWGGVSTNSKYYLHEGMTEFLTVKTMKKHESFFKDKTHEIKVFEPYEHFVYYAKMMECIFPNAVTDLYFNGKEATEKYKHKDFCLEKMIDDFSSIQIMSDLDTNYEKDKIEQEARKLLKVLTRQNSDVKKLLDKKIITKQSFDNYLSLTQKCYNKTLHESKVVLPHEFEHNEILTK